VLESTDCRKFKARQESPISSSNLFCSEAGLFSLPLFTIYLLHLFFGTSVEVPLKIPPFLMKEHSRRKLTPLYLCGSLLLVRKPQTEHCRRTTAVSEIWPTKSLAQLACSFVFSLEENGTEGLFKRIPLKESQRRLIGYTLCYARRHRLRSKRLQMWPTNRVGSGAPG
jgi:hypothetical protein